MVFGVFDRLHDGHRHFLRQARTEGDWLIAVVTPDHIVHQLKGYMPEEQMGDRIEMLHREGLPDQVIEGDLELGTWDVLRSHKPNVIALGYDQDALREEIEATVGQWGWSLEVVMMAPYKPETHHSSIRRAHARGR
jgi:cytidyltransferase-like protein